MITVKRVKDNFMVEIKQLKITEFQKKYVDIDIEDIQKLTFNYSNIFNYVVYNDNDIIGFACFVLDDEGDMNLLKFMIDYRYQGNGYAKEALEGLLDIIKIFVIKEEIWLSVHPHNTIAIAVFEKVGFIQKQTQYDAGDEIFFIYSY